MRWRLLEYAGNLPDKLEYPHNIPYKSHVENMLCGISYFAVSAWVEIGAAKAFDREHTLT